MENYKILCNFIIDLLNTHFEISFLQQIVDVLKNDQEYFTILLDMIFQKFFIGRNCLIKNNDLRFILKNTLSIYGPNFYMTKLLKFMNSKSQGGARTSFQLNHVFNLMTFILEISSSRLTNDETFKEKISEDYFLEFTKSLIKMVKTHLAEDTKEKNAPIVEVVETETKEKKTKKKSDKKKNFQKKANLDFVLISLANYLDRLFTFEKKNGYSNSDLTNVNEKLLKIVGKISTSLNYKNVLNKIENIENKNKEVEEKVEKEVKEENMENVENAEDETMNE